MKINLDIKEATEEFIPFIFATWLHSYKHGSYFCKKITKNIFFKHHHKILTELVDKKSVKVLCASPIDDPVLVLGYIVFEKNESDDVVHYIYVKRNFRSFGIANRLLEEAKIDLKQAMFTHWSFDTDWIVQKFPDLANNYNPYLLFS